MGATIKNVYILVKNGVILNVWTNLTFLCVDMKDIDENFPSYSTLAKKSVKAKEEGRMDFKAVGGQAYTIFIFKVMVGEERRKVKKDPPLDNGLIKQ